MTYLFPIVLFIALGYAGRMAWRISVYTAALEDRVHRHNPDALAYICRQHGIEIPKKYRTNGPSR